ncbi:MAG: NAD(P)H-hydrate dehydratase [Burkholderiales bacterium]|nr:NAD(P)H-hydrate dehydratase [Burkholderiales bacterium]
MKKPHEKDRLNHASPILRVKDLRDVEQAALGRSNPPPLMQLAGLAAAGLARELAGDSGKSVLIIAGPGNNGGDALVAALQLRQWWFNTVVVCPLGCKKYRGDAADALKAWQSAGGEILDTLPANGDWALVIDGLFGIGLQRDLDAASATLVDHINALGAPVLALDIPSGLDADTGCVRGAAIAADHTLTFIALKPGLLTGDGPDHCGTVHVASLGLAAETRAAPHGVLIGAGVLQHVLPPRLRNSHKGSYGNPGIVGGAAGMSGAALLAGRAALKCGAGKVHVGLLDTGLAVDPLQPELMMRTADSVLRMSDLGALAIGPGLGDSADAAEYLDWALESACPLLADADALNLVAAFPRLKTKLKQRLTENTILTPHPAEAGRLLGISTAEIQADRVTAALRLASELNSAVVLKGCGSICAWPDGHWAINHSGNPGMASAGMGDVLSGLIVALLAQGVPERHALTAAVYLHGAAADRLVAQGTGPVGLTAGEIADAARQLLNAAVSGA